MNLRTAVGIFIVTAAISAMDVVPSFGSKTIASSQDSTIANGIYVEGVDLSGMSVQEAEEAVSSKAEEMVSTIVNMTMGDNVITSSLRDLGYTWTNTDVVEKLAQFGKSGNIVERYKEQKDLENSTAGCSLEFSVDRDRVASFVQTCSAYNTDPVEGQLFIGDDGYPYVEGGTDGITLDAEASTEAVIDAIGSWQGGEITVELIVNVTSPEVTYETLSLVHDILGSATTDYSASSSARAVNVENGCNLIDGTLVWPGEEFSVTSAVTPFTEENGYLPAPTYEENRTVDSYGGGICQVSTTLYNAALKAEMDITARSNHTMMVAYVEPAKDAAIAEGIMDMSFVNNTDAPIYIEGYCYGAQITFVIFGHETRPSNRTLDFESKILSQTDPSGYSLYPDATQNVGYVMQTQSPHTGYQAELWKYVYVDGVLTEEIKINSSFYQAVGTIYSIGVVSTNASITQALYAAIAANSLETVQQIIKTGSATGQSETTVQTDAATGNTTLDDGTIIISG